MLSWGAFAQGTGFPVVTEIAEVESSEGQTILEVFNMLSGDRNSYYLDAGTLGIGGEILQINLDPINKLFIPLGETLSEAVATLEGFQELFQTPGETREVEGCFGLIPDDSRVPVRLLSRKLIFTRLLEFSIREGELFRSTSVARSDFNSLLSSVKWYLKLHPEE